MGKRKDEAISKRKGEDAAPTEGKGESFYQDFAARKGGAQIQIGWKALKKGGSERKREAHH